MTQINVRKLKIQLCSRWSLVSMLYFSKFLIHCAYGIIFYILFHDIFFFSFFFQPIKILQFEIEQLVKSLTDKQKTQISYS